MDKKRFMVVSGFLGAGKTTTMVALTEYSHTNRRRLYLLYSGYIDRENRASEQRAERSGYV